MKATYNKSKIMRNAWYLKRIQPSKSFGECLRKAWRSEKMNVMTARVEGRIIDNTPAKPYQPTHSEFFVAGCLNYYANARRGQYFGD